MQNKTDSLFEKLNKGLKLSYQKLVRDKAKEDGELIFCEDGKIIRVKAKDLLKTK